jgi:poly-beta-hydroxybutyrate-responsive repressor
MSSRSPRPRTKRRAGSGKAERYIQPSILLSLRRRPSYGYEIIQTIQEFGFVEGQAPPGMIYRHLRELEAAGLVTSAWKTEEAGPARRVYELTPEGQKTLSLWAEYMEQQARKLTNFIRTYRRAGKRRAAGKNHHPGPEAA